MVRVDGMKDGGAVMKNGFSRDFVLVVIGQIISLFGNAVVRFALPVHLLEVTGSAAVLGVVSGLAFLPMALMAPIGGIIADRVNKRNIMVFLDFFTCGLILLFLILYGKVDLVGMVLILLLLLYGISGAYQPSVQASIPVLVEESRVMQANAVVNMVSSLSGLLGPALGGAAYSVCGILPVMAVAAGCFFCSAVMEIFIHIPYMKRTGSLPVLREAAGECVSSIVYITREKPEVGKLTLCAAGVNLFMSGLMIVGLPVIVMQELRFDPAEGSRMYGYMQAILGAGGLAGGLGAGVLGQRMRMEQSYLFLMLAGVLLIPMGLVLALPCPPYAAYAVIALAALAIMACASVYSIQVMAQVQTTVPAHLVGKVIAWVLALSNCAQPVGQILYGALFENMRGIIPVIFFGAAAVTVLIGWYSRGAVSDFH